MRHYAASRSSDGCRSEPALTCLATNRRFSALFRFLNPPVVLELRQGFFRVWSRGRGDQEEDGPSVCED